MASLTSSLAQLANVTTASIEREFQAELDAEEQTLDPIRDPLSLPEEREVLTLGQLLERAQRPGRLDITGLRGAALPLLVSKLAGKLKKPVVVITSDVDRARGLLQDVETFLGSRSWSGQQAGADEEAAEDAEDAAVGEALFLPAPDASPYAEVSPDRRAAIGRLATLCHLTQSPWKVLVLPAAGLVRRVVPRIALEARIERVVAEDELDRDRLMFRLVEAGYLRVPVVEDPGSFAVRGALLDVWPPSSKQPVRIELYGELVLTIKPFDPESQRAGESTLEHVLLPPAREVILDDNSVSRAKREVLDLCDPLNVPTAKARQLAEDVALGRAFFGAEGWLPAYYPQLDPIFNYLPDDTSFIIDDPLEVIATLREELTSAQRDEQARLGSPHVPFGRHYIDEADVAARFSKARVLIHHRIAISGGSNEDDGPLGPFETAPADLPTLGARDHEDLLSAIKQARASKGKRGALTPLVRRLRVFQEAGLRTILTARTLTQAERLVALLRGHEVNTRARIAAFNPEWLDDPTFGRDVVEVGIAGLGHGVILPTERLVLITEEEVFGARQKRKAARRGESAAKDAARPFLEDLRALAVGDLVVHAEHGVGRYLGLEHRDILGPPVYELDGTFQQPRTRVDLLAVEYSNGDRLYLPVHRLNQIQKFVGGEGATARLDRLGGSTFAKTKSRVEKAVRQMADELLKLYAERQAMVGEALPIRGDDYAEFEATFPFEETQDQAKAIDDVLRDLETARPMDRLVCGDVGFGKTEVAIRAAYRAASSGHQVAVLCPTTVLAQQHYLTFKSRLEGLPILVAPMSRFQDEKEQRETIKKLKEGKVDIVVGTHRLLSKDVHFKDLGLLVVDEEQRFGVTHKERIKQLKTQVHVLTLTATPIPRTLQMAVSGLRDLSLITTPPVDRRAIRTIVTRMDDQVIRDAVERELSRGGQVFYVHNRIGLTEGGGIYEKAEKVQQLVPRARVCVAHGQMGEKALEQIMLDFVEGRYDVLCATAIIESGLDIPRANTILIDRADMFGLSQLYQLRGRVGRSKERAYCYLIVPPHAAMTDEARARIEALEKHTELGAGFKIASLDLEIRGAGDILGGEQSGNVGQVGFEMFCSMLDDAVRELRGDVLATVSDIEPELSFDVEAYLPDDYVGDVGVRLSLYKRFASAVDEEWVSELSSEMEDRFGPPPEVALRYVHQMRLKCELRSLRALGCEASRERVTLHLRADTPLDPQKLLPLVGKKGSPWKLTPDMRLSKRLDVGEAKDGLDALERVLAEVSKHGKVD